MSLNLYNILKSVLNESIDQNSVSDAIENRTRVLIDYSDEDNNAPGQRLIEPYALGITKAGNLALRAYQYQGATLRGIPKWKLFRLDRINKWKPLKNSIFELQPKDQGFDAPAYNENGDNSLVSVITQVHFNKGDENLYQPSLDKLRKQTDQLVNHSNALDLSKLETIPSGPIRQKKNNIYTSRPNSKKYTQYRQNLANSERDADEMQKYWGDYDRAEQEKQAQQRQLHKDDDLDNYRGPIKNFDDEDYDDEYNDYDDYDDEYNDYNDLKNGRRRYNYNTR